MATQIRFTKKQCGEKQGVPKLGISVTLVVTSEIDIKQ